MYLDYSKIEFDRDGNPEMPELMLKTLSDKVIGVIPGVHKLKLNINQVRFHSMFQPSSTAWRIPYTSICVVISRFTRNTMACMKSSTQRHPLTVSLKSSMSPDTPMRKRWNLKSSSLRKVRSTFGTHRHQQILCLVVFKRPRSDGESDMSHRH